MNTNMVGIGILYSLLMVEFELPATSKSEAVASAQPAPSRKTHFLQHCAGQSESEALKHWNLCCPRSM
eukprot:500170-Lingulodinium_polyedra.AAC.1